VKSYIILAIALMGSFVVTFGTMYFAIGKKQTTLADGQVVQGTAADPLAAISDSLRLEELKWEQQIEEYRRELFDVDSLKAVSDSLRALINKQQAKLASLTAEIEKTEAILQAAQDQRVKKLAKIFSSMQPSSVDSLAARVNDNFMVAVLLSMREKNAAKILAALKPSRAARIARKMSVNLR
jgi:flagellar motility protein MotE (MotC chaperone)